MALNVTAAWAWSDVTGMIKSIDMKKHEITLDDGKTYMVEKKVKLSDLKTGDKVMVSTEVQKGKNMANKVTKSS
jgi:Cu/Ag efflux protein CusF